MRSVWCGGCVQACVGTSEEGGRALGVMWWLRTGVSVSTSEEGGRALGVVWWSRTGVCVDISEKGGRALVCGVVVAHRGVF